MAKEETKKIEFKNEEAKLFVELLSTIKTQNDRGMANRQPLLLHGPAARSRNKLVLLVEPHLEEVEKKRLAIVDKHSRKDAEGKPAMINGGLNFDISDKDAFDKEFQVLMDEKIEFEIEPDMRNHWSWGKNYLLNELKSQMDVDTTKIYEGICTQLETI